MYKASLWFTHPGMPKIQFVEYDFQAVKYLIL